VNAFLYAEVGTEPRGLPLSVLSALSRLGLDPWQEAVRLARLPRKTAADGLAEHIATMPASPWSPVEAMAIATRLVLLLPSGNGTPAPAAPRPAKAQDSGFWHGLVPAGWRWSDISTVRQWAILLVVLAGAIAAVVLTLPGHQDPTPGNAVGTYDRVAPPAHG
jgi:hypothetical protein